MHGAVHFVFVCLQALSTQLEQHPQDASLGFVMVGNHSTLHLFVVPERHKVGTLTQLRCPTLSQFAVCSSPFVAVAWLSWAMR